MVGLGVDQLGLAHAKSFDCLGRLVLGTSSASLYGLDPANAATRRRPPGSVENNDFMIVDLHSRPGQLLP
jgi:hypothetical protein